MSWLKEACVDCDQFDSAEREERIEAVCLAYPECQCVMSQVGRKVLWLADIRGWAYDSIVDQVNIEIAKLPRPQSENPSGWQVWYMMERNWKAEEDVRLFREKCNAADVIVCMYLRYFEAVESHNHHKVVTMLTGMRPFEGRAS